MKQKKVKTVILPRPEHNLSRSLVDPDALWVMRKLKREGHKAYLVGGAVRDILLGIEPKDFDIGTDAPPSVLRSLFRNSRIIGRRFRIVHIYFRRKDRQDKIIEVTTFRGPNEWSDEDEVHPDDMDQTGNAFGSPEEDAWRRDFTVNALFYDISDFSIIDHTGGLADIEKKTIRLIGEPDVRFEEDPVRMLRAIEFAVRLGFKIESATEKGIRQHAGLIVNSSPARLREELRQMQARGITAEVLAGALELGLYSHLFPELAAGPGVIGLMGYLDSFAGGNGKKGEYCYIAALAIETVANAAPFTAETSLDDAHDAIYPVVGDICAGFQISAHIRHQARELLLGCYRVARGKSYRAKGKFTGKAEFKPTLDFFGAYLEASGQSGEVVEYWENYLKERGAERPHRSRSRRRRPRRSRSRRDAVAKRDEQSKG